MKRRPNEKPEIDKLAAAAFGALSHTVPDRLPSREEIRSIVASSARIFPPRASQRNRSALPIAAAALALFMLLPLVAGGRGPSLAETAATAYESGAFRQYGAVFFGALTRGAVRPSAETSEGL